MEAAAKPLPSDDTTPPVTKMYFAAMPTSVILGVDCAAWFRKGDDAARKLGASDSVHRGAQPIMNGIAAFGKMQLAELFSGNSETGSETPGSNARRRDSAHRPRIAVKFAEWNMGCNRESPMANSAAECVFLSASVRQRCVCTNRQAAGVERRQLSARQSVGGDGRPRTLFQHRAQ